MIWQIFPIFSQFSHYTFHLIQVSLFHTGTSNSEGFKICETTHCSFLNCLTGNIIVQLDKSVKNMLLLTKPGFNEEDQLQYKTAPVQVHRNNLDHVSS